MIGWDGYIPKPWQTYSGVDIRICPVCGAVCNFKVCINLGWFMSEYVCQPCFEWAYSIAGDLPMRFGFEGFYVREESKK